MERGLKLASVSLEEKRERNRVKTGRRVVCGAPAGQPSQQQEKSATAVRMLTLGGYLSWRVFTAERIESFLFLFTAFTFVVSILFLYLR